MSPSPTQNGSKAAATTSGDSGSIEGEVSLGSLPELTLSETDEEAVEATLCEDGQDGSNNNIARYASKDGVGGVGGREQDLPERDTPFPATETPSPHEVSVAYTTHTGQLPEDLEDPDRSAASCPAAGSDQHAKPGHSSPLRPSKMRTCLMNLVGVSFVVAGVAWAVWYSAHGTKYARVETGRPVAASACSQSDLIECQRLPAWQRNCILGIEYNFTVMEHEQPEGLEAAAWIGSDPVRKVLTYSGFDILPFASASEACHELVQSNIKRFLNTSNFTVYYDPKNPDENHYHEPHKASSLSGIIAGIMCGIGAMIMFTSFLECIL